MLTKNRRTLLDRLNQLYPDPHSELNFRNEYELLICVILSAQCTDKKVNETTPALFKKYGDFSKLARARVEDVETIIRQVNYYRTKSKNIIETAKVIAAEYDGKVPLTIAELISLPGVGRKTANVIICERGIIPALAVDTHVFRVSKRLGAATGDTPEQVEESLKQRFPPESWRNLHHQLIFHGRRVCKARGPMCSVCGLAEICPSRKLFSSAAVEEGV